jgi:hypothetical protein
MAATVDGVGPTSGVGPATGAGPADVTKLDPSKGNATPAIRKGAHASPGGHISAAPKRSSQKTSGPSAVGLPKKTRAAIKKDLTELNKAKGLWSAAADRLIEKPNDPALRKAVVDEKMNLTACETILASTIMRETDQLSPRSSFISFFVPNEQRDTLTFKPPSATKVREFEAKVISDVPASAADRDEVADAILLNKEWRVARELRLVSAAMQAVKNRGLNPSQAEERKSIVADVRDCVTQARPVQEIGRAPEELAKAQLDRFKSIADDVTKPEGTFDPFLFDMLKNEVRASIGEAYRDEFDHLVASYSSKLAQRY